MQKLFLLFILLFPLTSFDIKQDTLFNIDVNEFDSYKYFEYRIIDSNIRLQYLRYTYDDSIIEHVLNDGIVVFAKKRIVNRKFQNTFSEETYDPQNAISTSLTYNQSPSEVYYQITPQAHFSILYHENGMPNVCQYYRGEKQWYGCEIDSTYTIFEFGRYGIDYNVNQREEAEGITTKIITLQEGARCGTWKVKQIKNKMLYTDSVFYKCDGKELINR